MHVSLGPPLHLLYSGRATQLPPATAMRYPCSTRSACRWASISSAAAISAHISGTVISRSEPKVAFASDEPPGSVSTSVDQIGRASCRERVCQYVEVSVVAVSLQKKQHSNQNSQSHLYMLSHI